MVSQDAALRQASGQAFHNTSRFTLRPLRLRVDLGPANLAKLQASSSHLRMGAVSRNAQSELGATAEGAAGPLCDVVKRVAKKLGPGPHLDWNAVVAAIEADAEEHDVKLPAAQVKVLRECLTVKDEKAEPVLRSSPRSSHLRMGAGKSAESEFGATAGASQNAQSEFGATAEGATYEPDPDLRDAEHVPLLEEGGIRGFFEREVLPHVPDAWIDEDKTGIGRSAAGAH